MKMNARHIRDIKSQKTTNFNRRLRSGERLISFPLNLPQSQPQPPFEVKRLVGFQAR
jgi:hypothetical protein